MRRRPPDDPPPAPTPDETAAFIASMTPSLILLARNSRLHTARFLLEMLYIEAATKSGSEVR